MTSKNTKSKNFDTQKLSTTECQSKNNTNNQNTQKYGKKQLTPYQKFLQGKDAKYNKYKQCYFDFYDDIKDKTHKIIDW